MISFFLSGAGMEPMTIIDRGLVPGMDIVGEKFRTGEYFLPHLIIAASGMKQSMELLEPELNRRGEKARTLGTAVFSGMIGVTLFGIFLTPVFFYAIQGVTDWRQRRNAQKQEP